MTDVSTCLGRPSIMWGRNPYPHSGENLGTGNRCGHNPLKPEFHLFSEPEWSASIPQVMRKLVESVKGYYYAPLNILPSLGNLNGKRNKSGDPRKNRSEARAVEVLVMRAILYFTEYASLRVGTPKADGQFIPRSCTELAAVAGLLKKKKVPSEPDEPSERFWRAFRRLRKAGAFDVHLQYVEKPDGTKRARPAIKRLNENFLVALGAVSFEALKTFRTRCSNEIKKARRAYKEKFPRESDAEKARTGLRRAQGESGVVTFAVSERRSKAINYDDAKAQYAAEIRDRHAELLRNNPDLSQPEVARRVMREFPAFDNWLRERQGG